MLRNRSSHPGPGTFEQKQWSDLEEEGKGGKEERKMDNGWMDGWEDGWVDRWMGGRKERRREFNSPHKVMKRRGSTVRRSLFSPPSPCSCSLQGLSSLSSSSGHPHKLPNAQRSSQFIPVHPERACHSQPSLLISCLLLEHFWALSNLIRAAFPLHFPGLHSTCSSNSRAGGVGQISRLFPGLSRVGGGGCGQRDHPEG